MRIPLAVELESRDGTISRDSVTQNSMIEIEGEASVIFKRPGVFASQLDYVTPQGFSGLSFTDLPYGEFTDISDLFFGINGDSWSLVNAGTSSGIWDGPQPPVPEGSITYHGTPYYLSGDYNQFYTFNGFIWGSLWNSGDDPVLVQSANGLDGIGNWSVVPSNLDSAVFNPVRIGSTLYCINTLTSGVEQYVVSSSDGETWAEIAGSGESDADWAKKAAFLQGCVSSGTLLVHRNTSLTYGTLGIYTSDDAVAWTLVLDFTPLDSFTRGLIQGIVPNGLGEYYCLRPITTFPNSQGLQLGWALAASTNLVDWFFYDIESDLATTGKTVALVANGTSLMVLEKSTVSSTLNIRGLDISGAPEMTSVLDSYILDSSSYSLKTNFAFGADYLTLFGASNGAGSFLKVTMDLNP